MQLLSFMLGGVTFGIPIGAVQSIEQRMSIIQIPNSLPYIKGIVHLHGTVIPIYSLATKFGYAQQGIENIIVVEVNQLQIGLEVCGGQKILEVEASKILPMPEIMSHNQQYIKDIANYKKDLIVMLDLEGLVSLKEQEDIQKLVEDV